LESLLPQDFYIALERAIDPEDPNFQNHNDNIGIDEILKANKVVANYFIPVLGVFFLFKNDAFKEEKEHRLFSLITHKPVTGIVANNKIKLSFLEKLKYQSKGFEITPYYDISFADVKSPPFEKIYLGPKNTTPIEFLRLGLFKDFKLPEETFERSKASYR